MYPPPHMDVPPPLPLVNLAQLPGKRASTYSSALRTIKLARLKTIKFGSVAGKKSLDIFIGVEGHQVGSVEDHQLGSVAGEKGLDIFIGVEDHQIIHLFPHADKLDRNPEFVHYRDYYASFGGTI
jgi:hypothetical protein